MGRAYNNLDAVPFAELAEATLSERGHGREAREWILGEFASWARKRPLMTEKDARGEIVLAEMAYRARRKAHDGG